MSSFGLTVAELREKHRQSSEAARRKRQESCYPVWLAAIREEVLAAAAQSQTTVTVPIPALEACTRLYSLNEADAQALKAAIEANGSEFSVTVLRAHPYECDCGRDCFPRGGFRVQWSWE